MAKTSRTILGHTVYSEEHAAGQSMHVSRCFQLDARRIGQAYSQASKLIASGHHLALQGGDPAVVPRVRGVFAKWGNAGEMVKWCNDCFSSIKGRGRPCIEYFPSITGGNAGEMLQDLLALGEIQWGNC